MLINLILIVDLTVLCDNNAIIAQRQSVQHSLLNEIKRNDMFCFLTPKETQEKCVKAGLIPLFVYNTTDISNNTVSIALVYTTNIY